MCPQPEEEVQGDIYMSRAQTCTFSLACTYAGRAPAAGTVGVAAHGHSLLMLGNGASDDSVGLCDFYKKH